MKDEYATMLGYTYDELILNFDAHIDNSAEKMGLGKVLEAFRADKGLLWRIFL